MSRAPAGKINLAGIWAFHILYFVFAEAKKKAYTMKERACDLEP